MPSTVVALEVSETNLELERKVGADDVFKSDQNAVRSVKDLTDGLGADVVFDFVGIQATADLGARMTRVRGDWNLVGIGGGVAKVGFGLLPYECQVFSPYWGTRADLYDVVELAMNGATALPQVADPPPGQRRCVRPPVQANRDPHSVRGEMSRHTRQVVLYGC